VSDDPRHTELERAFRDGLRQAADRADVGVPLAQRAQTGARTRRHRRWAAAGTVAAVVAVSGTAFALGSGSDPDPRQSADRATTAPTFAPVTKWRAESWHGLTVDVPADWGWGTAPIEMSFDAGTQVICGGPGAMVEPDGTKGVNPKGDTPWVGRPIMLSDACQAAPFGEPQAPYVWLGADVEPGTEELGDGYTQETVEEFGTTLTVASQDPALRQYVLDSARATSDCEAQLPSRPAVVGMPIEGLDPVHSAQLCAYQQGEDGLDLVYAATLDEATARSLYAGDGLGSQSADDFCPSKFAEYVRVRFSGKDAMGDAELSADWVVDPGCQQVEVGPGFVLPLKESGLSALSRNGLPVVLRSFIGMLG
jgi:hypothetical protein